MNQVNQIIEEHDVFFFLFGISLLPENKDFEIIRKAGKKIISSFNGSDIRYWQALGQETGIDYTSYTGEEANTVFKPQRLYQILPTLRRGEIYADLVMWGPSCSGMALRPGRNSFCPIDLSQYQCHVPERDIPVVVHAPSNQAIKGTKFILKALDELQEEGVKFDLRLLHNVPNAQVVETLLDADCAIDQALLGGGIRFVFFRFFRIYLLYKLGSPRRTGNSIFQPCRIITRLVHRSQKTCTMGSNYVYLSSTRSKNYYSTKN